jgi:hypothetical protein
VVVILDDYSRAVLAAGVFPTDSSYHTLLTLRQAMERYGRPRVLYADNDSKFRLTRYQRSRFFTYHQETLQGVVVTEVGRALRELDIQLLSHLPGNAQAKGKIERFFRFLQERVLDHNQASRLEELQALVDRWVEEYNTRHVNRDTGCTPAERLRPSVARPLEGDPEDIFCLKEEPKVAKDHTITPRRGELHPTQRALLGGLQGAAPYPPRRAAEGVARWVPGGGAASHGQGPHAGCAVDRGGSVGGHSSCDTTGPFLLRGLQIVISQVRLPGKCEPR